MTTTRASLLLRVRDHQDATAWEEFHSLYTPLLYRFARTRGLTSADAEEVRDQCMEVVSRKMPTFEYDKQKGGFKNWLYRIANHKVIDLVRKNRERVADSQEMRAMTDPLPTPAELWEMQWKKQHLKFCVERISVFVSERDHKVFRMLLFDECSVEQVCEHLDMNRNQVYKAKSRVLQRIRENMAEFDGEGPGR